MSEPGSIWQDSMHESGGILMEPILEIRHLSIYFTQYERGVRQRQLPVIRDLSLRILPGQITAVVGASEESAGAWYPGDPSV